MLDDCLDPATKRARESQSAQIQCAAADAECGVQQAETGGDTQE